MRRPRDAQRPYVGGQVVVEGGQVVVGDVHAVGVAVGYEVLCRRPDVVTPSDAVPP